jgi:hypothetical protein
MITTLHYAAKRRITYNEFNDMLIGFTNQGFDVAPLASDTACGITIECESGTLVVEFVQVHSAVPPLPHTDRVFMSGTWKKWTAPVWSLHNRIEVRCSGPGITPGELVAIKLNVATFLNLAENVIRTEGRGIRPTDMATDIRIYLNFCRETAKTKWTLPDPDHPSVESLRTFMCWNCNTRQSHHDFLDFSGDEHKTGFDACLEMYTRECEVWCNGCADRLECLTFTESDSKRLRTN